MKSAPRWMKIDPEVYLADTAGLTTEEHGAYILLLIALWRRRGFLPLDHRMLCRIARVGRQRWVSIWERLAPLMSIEGDRFGCPSVTRLIAREAVARENGRRGGAVTKRRRQKELGDAVTFSAPASAVPSVAFFGLLCEAASENVDRAAPGITDVAPIKQLLEDGCELYTDILPVIREQVPGLSSPLRNWGAKWLMAAIRARRDGNAAAGPTLQAQASNPTQRPPNEAGEALHNGNTQAQGALDEDDEPPIAPLPEMTAWGERPQNGAQFDWGELVEAFKAGMLEWNAARLGPAPGLPGCRAPAEVLKTNGYGA